MCLGLGGQARVCQHRANPQVCELGLHLCTHTVPALTRLLVRTKRALYKNPLGTCTVAGMAWAPLQALGCQRSPSTVGARTLHVLKAFGCAWRWGTTCAYFCVRSTDSSQPMPRRRDYLGGTGRAQAEARGSRARQPHLDYGFSGRRLEQASGHEGVGTPLVFAPCIRRRRFESVFPDKPRVKSRGCLTTWEPRSHSACSTDWNLPEGPGQWDSKPVPIPLG